MESLENSYPTSLHVPLRIIMTLMNIVIIASGIIMALTFFAVVVVRYGFGADLFAYEEWLLVIAIWMFFLASAVATHNGAHVKADMLGFMIKSPRLLHARAVLVECLELIITLVILYWGYLMIKESLEAYPNWQETVALDIPFLVPRLGIFLGFLMMAVYSALRLYVLAGRRDRGLSAAQAD